MNRMILKKWIVAVDKLYTQYSAIYLDIINEKNTKKLLALPQNVISFTQEEQNLLHKLTVRGFEICNFFSYRQKTSAVFKCEEG